MANYYNENPSEQNNTYQLYDNLTTDRGYKRHSFNDDKFNPEKLKY